MIALRARARRLAVRRSISAINSVAATLALAALASMAGCSDATAPLPAGELQRAMARWQAHRPAAYQYTLARSCYCLPEYTAPVVIEVHDGAVIGAHYEGSGAPVANLGAIAPTIDGLFGVIGDAIGRGAEYLDAHYDDARGYPARVSIDYVKRMADDELAFSIRDFREIAK